MSATEERLPQTPSQTVGPYFAYGLTPRQYHYDHDSAYTPVLAEIRSLGIDPGHHGTGLGSRLVRYFIDAAVELHIPRVFVLTRAPKFFEKLGFRLESMDLLPEKVFKRLKF